MFARGEWLVLLLAVPVILAAGSVASVRRSARWRRAGLRAERVVNRRLRLVLWAGAAICAIIALAGPVWGVEAELVEAHGTAIVLVLDVSASMDAVDLLPSRLERAKIAAADILTGADGQLFGLVLFAGEAFVQFPLTGDLDTARAFVQSANSRVMTFQGTAIADALRQALDIIDTRISGAAAIVLMTDGENHSGDPLAVADEAAARGVPIHVIGYGTEDGDVIPVFDAAGEAIGLKANAAREIVVSRLDEPILQEIASRTAGIYQRASVTGVESVAILNVLSDLNAATFGTRLQTTAISRYGVFTALALLLLTAEWFVRERVT